MELQVVFALFTVGSLFTNSLVQGDPNAVQTKAGRVGTLFNCGDGNLKRLEVLPGGGWDNLRNVDMGRITYFNYSLCKTTEDGMYFLPDNTFVIPLKESKVQTFASLYDHWTNFSSTTATTINAEAHGSFFFGSISGSYSTSHRSVKKSQVEDKSFTTRVQLRHTVYKVMVQPDCQLDPAFKRRLMEIAAHIQSNGKRQAAYLADQLIRDFGTHVVTAIDAGAVIARVENVKTSFKYDYKEDDSKIKAAASASFFKVFGISGSYSKSVNQTFIDQYLGNVTNSYTETWGGLPFQANFSVNTWTAALRNNLVAVDRAGDPLHFVITSAVLPELPEPTLWDLASVVENAIKQYYSHNRYLGCMTPSSQNFNFQANEDDGTCSAKSTNFTFGGIYQTCTVQGSPGHNPCAGYLQLNPKTRAYKCPSSYQAVKVLEGTTSSNCHRSCDGSWFWRHCSTDCGHGVFATYWCVATKNIPQSSGFLFGGMYSKSLANPVTKAQRCPPKFYPQQFGATMKVCISDDYELAARYSISFGGFFSCASGNPLSLVHDASFSLQELMSYKSTDGLGSLPVSVFMYQQGPKSWPKHCPSGFSQHLAAIENNCEIMFCVKAKAFSVQGLPPIRRPPFSEAPGLSSNTTVPLVIVNNDRGKVYFQDMETSLWHMATKSNIESISNYSGLSDFRSGSSAAKDDGIGPGAAAAISVVSTLALALIVLLLFTKCKLGRSKSREQLLRSIDRYDGIPHGVAENAQ